MCALEPVLTQVLHDTVLTLSSQHHLFSFKYHYFCARIGLFSSLEGCFLHQQWLVSAVFPLPSHVTAHFESLLISYFSYVQPQRYYAGILSGVGHSTLKAIMFYPF